MADPQQDAFSYIQSVLDSYGLGSLSTWAWNEIVNGASTDQVAQDLRKTPEYAARFPGMNELRAKGQAITENQWIAYQQTAEQFAHQYGLPDDLFTDAKIGQYITNNVSVAELAQRAQEAQQAAYQHYDVEGARLYGVTPGDFTAALLDPETAAPLVAQKLQAAQAATFAKTSGFGELGLADATRVGQMGLDSNTVQAGFNQLAAESELFKPLDQGENQIGTGQQIGAQFGGDASAQADIAARARRRTAVFDEGGSFSSGQSGFAGVG